MPNLIDDAVGPEAAVNVRENARLDAARQGRPMYVYVVPAFPGDVVPRFGWHPEPPQDRPYVTAQP